VVVDHNQVESDRSVQEIGVCDQLEARIRSFGWHVVRADGHDFTDIRRAWTEVLTTTDRPTLVIADTVKGRGVSFMEHPVDLARIGGFYRWHAGAPTDEAFVAARTEIRGRVLAFCERVGIAPPELPVPAEMPAPDVEADVEAEEPSGVNVGAAFGHALERLGKQRDDVVVLDAGLRAKGHLSGFARRFPDRFVECGIAEQDMVSTASGLALAGFLPVVSSFAAFLSSRANEQIYNISCEGSRVFYALHYGGLTPAAAGITHQSVRDISLLASLPDVVVVEPSSEGETERLLDHAAQRGMESWAFRLQMGRTRHLPVPVPDRPVVLGQGTRILDGSEASVMAYGPRLLAEAVDAALLLRDRGVSVRVINMPFLNRVDGDWLEQEVCGRGPLYVIDDHSPVGGLADHVQTALASVDPLTRPRLVKLAVRGLPAWGTDEEALHAHGLDAASLATRLKRELGEGDRSARVA
jgi:transketolase